MRFFGHLIPEDILVELTNLYGPLESLNANHVTHWLLLQEISRRDAAKAASEKEKAQLNELGPKSFQP